MENLTHLNVLNQYAPTGRMVLVTPEIAAEWLKHNNNNPRKSINMSMVASYATDMKAGKWLENGEPIVFDANGDLKNGQHRLLAVVKAGVSVNMFVITGIDPGINLFDHARVRRLFQEFNYSVHVETIAKFIVSDAYRINTAPVAVVGNYMQQHSDEMNKAIRLSSLGAGNNPIAKKRDVYCTIYLMLRHGIDEAEIETFMRVVNSQFMLPDRESTSAIVLYKYLANNYAFNARRNSLNNMAFCLAAFNDFANGVKRTRAYRYVDTGHIKSMLAAVRQADGLTF